MSDRAQTREDGFDRLALLVVLVLAVVAASLVVLARPRPPSMVGVSPPDGARDVGWRTQVVVTFSRPIDNALGRGGLRLEPAADGFVSAAGRRAAFTPRFGLRADTEYAIVLDETLRDRGGQPVAQGVAGRFRTRALGMVLLALDGGLVRVRPGAAPETVAGPGVGAFAVSAEGAIAHVRTPDGTLVILPPGPGSARRLSLPARLDVHELAWSPDGHALVLLGLVQGEPGVGALYVARLDRDVGRVARLTSGGGPLDVGTPLLTEILKKSLIEVVYRRDSFAFTPDGRAVIARDRNWDLAVFDLEGERQQSVGAYLGVGNTSPFGDALVMIDVEPSDGALRRQVLLLQSDGASRILSDPERDSREPSFAHQSRRVVFTSAPPVGPPGERRFAVEVVDAAAGTHRRLTDPPDGQSDSQPRWAPDDSRIMFRRAPLDAPLDRGRMWTVSPEGGAPTPVAPEAIDGRFSP
jgi:hypothetical protein